MPNQEIKSTSWQTLRVEDILLLVQVWIKVMVLMLKRIRISNKSTQEKKNLQMKSCKLHESDFCYAEDDLGTPVGPDKKKDNKSQDQESSWQ